MGTCFMNDHIINHRWSSCLMEGRSWEFRSLNTAFEADGISHRQQAAMGNDADFAPSDEHSSFLRFLPQKKHFNRFDLNPKLKHEVYRSEPVGNVGKRWRYAFARYYATLLLHPISKVIVILVFGLNLLVIGYGFMKLNQGLEMKDLSPDDSYLKTYDTLVSSETKSQKFLLLNAFSRRVPKQE